MLVASASLLDDSYRQWLIFWLPINVNTKKERAYLLSWTLLLYSFSDNSCGRCNLSNLIQFRLSFMDFSFKSFSSLCVCVCNWFKSCAMIGFAWQRLGLCMLWIFFFAVGLLLLLGSSFFLSFFFFSCTRTPLYRTWASKSQVSRESFIHISLELKSLKLKFLHWTQASKARDDTF